jgi:hypothetical protein
MSRRRRSALALLLWVQQRIRSTRIAHIEQLAEDGLVSRVKDETVKFASKS